MRALVTGGAGFIGSTLVDALVGGGAEVVVVDDLSRGRREHLNAQARFHELDVREPGLMEIVRRAEPEVVFHHAAQIDVRRSIAEPLHDTLVNVAGTVNLLQACADSGVRRVVFASSGGTVYGDTDRLPTPEDRPLQPASVYGAAKVAGEIYGDMYRRLHGLEFVALRYANVYGPRQDPHGEAGVVAIFIQRLLAGAGATINGDGLQTRDYVYVDDVVAANLAAASTPELGAYNIGTARETDVREIHRLVAAACDSDAAPAHGPAKAGEQQRSCLSVGRARDLLRWTPAVGLETGIARTVDYFRAG